MSARRVRHTAFINIKIWHVHLRKRVVDGGWLADLYTEALPAVAVFFFLI